MIKAVLIEFTKDVCCRKKGERMWTSDHLADVYVKRRKIAKVIRRKKPKVIHAEM